MRCSSIHCALRVPMLVSCPSSFHDTEAYFQPHLPPQLTNVSLLTSNQMTLALRQYIYIQTCRNGYWQQELNVKSSSASFLSPYRSMQLRIPLLPNTAVPPQSLSPSLPLPLPRHYHRAFCSAPSMQPQGPPSNRRRRHRRRNCPRHSRYRMTLQ